MSVCEVGSWSLINVLFQLHRSGFPGVGVQVSKFQDRGIEPQCQDLSSLNSKHKP